MVDSVRESSGDMEYNQNKSCLIILINYLQLFGGGGGGNRTSCGGNTPCWQ